MDIFGAVETVSSGETKGNNEKKDLPGSGHKAGWRPSTSGRDAGIVMQSIIAVDASFLTRRSATSAARSRLSAKHFFVVTNIVDGSVT